MSGAEGNGPRLVVLGKQGAGKGTQCVRLSRHYKVPHIATGDIFRAARRSGSEYGRKIAEYMTAGDLVPDDLVVAAVGERLRRENGPGFVLDGFPRNVHQAEELARLLAPVDVDLAVDLQVPTEMVLERLAGRRVCQECGTNYSPASPPRRDWVCDLCGGEVVVRDDDRTDLILRRLKNYEEQTAPLVGWYRERRCLIEVDGVGAPDAVTQRLVDAIDAALEAQG